MGAGIFVAREDDYVSLNVGTGENMSSYSLKQRCIQVLRLNNERLCGMSSREVADALDISVYQARLLLLGLQDSGWVREVSGRKSGRGAALRWEVSDAASAAEF